MASPLLHKIHNHKSAVVGGVMTMNRIIVPILALFISACSESGYFQSESSKLIQAQVEASEYKSIDFSKIGGNAWTKVCFMGPYNEDSEKALGFPWHVSEYTGVLSSDGHNVIVFATESEVIEFVVHLRAYGDFWRLSGKCLNREESHLIKDLESGKWQNYVQSNA